MARDDGAVAMTARIATLAAGAILVVEAGVLVGIGFVDAALVRRGYGDQFDALAESWNWLWVVAIAVPGLVGAIIVRSRPHHSVGWLFLGLSVSLLASAVVDEWFTLAAIVDPPWVGGAGVAAVLADKSFFPWWPLLALILLLTPSGAYPSPKWRLVGKATVAFTVISFLLAVVGTEPLSGPYDEVGNPFAWEGVGDVARWGASAAFLVVAGGLILSGVSLVSRWRASTGDARRQMLWLAMVVVPLPVVIPVHLFAVYTDSPRLTVVTLVLFLVLIPVSAGLSVLRYRLYDVDRIVATTLTYSLLTMALTVVYAGVVWAGSRISMASIVWSPSPAVTATVGAVTAATLAAPLRTAIQTQVDRRFNRRAFDALRMVRDAVTGDRAGVDPQTLLRTALASESVTVSYPGTDGWVDAAGAAADRPPDQVLVSRGGRTVARIGYDPSQVDATTLSRVAEGTAAELDNTRLRAELQHHLAELAESRARLAEAQRAERRRIERDLHDGAQQTLLALAFELQSAQLDADPGRMRAALQAGVTSARDAVRQLRDLANGLHPQALTDGGLPAVLDDLSRRSPVAVRATCPPDRYPPALEFTCWLIIAEAVVNAQKHSHARTIDVAVAQTDRALHISVSDDGCGGADPHGAGLRGLRDRVEAAGGSAVITTGATGTSIEAVVPCGS